MNLTNKLSLPEALTDSFASRFSALSFVYTITIGDNNVIVMLFIEPLFKTFSSHEIGDTNPAVEVLFSIDVETREEVDEMAKKVKAAGGTIFGEPGEKDGWMYGCAFADLDGHRSSVLHMDMSKMPQQ